MVDGNAVVVFSMKNIMCLFNVVDIAAGVDIGWMS